jgi:hypothetical protein
MSSTRREFLRGALAAAVLLPLAGKSSGTTLLQAPVRAAGLDDSGLLEELERSAFEFFWHEADPWTGLVRDRASANGGDARRMSSIAATGFGLTALCIGHQRGYRPRTEITARVRRTLRFLAERSPHVHGFFYHYADMRNGARFALSEASPIDTSILLCGVLTCRQHFRGDRSIRRDATRIYNRVDWPWAMNNGGTFALAWTPELGFNRLRWDSYCESMMLYLLAIGSPTHPIAPECWHRFGRPAMEYQKYRYISAPAPLFVHQFSHAWFDFRGMKDEYADYFANSVLASQAHRQFCCDLSTRFPSYSHDLWGITASDSSQGYVAWGGPPMLGPVDGSIVPAAAAGSLPFTFPESMAVLHNLRRSYGKRIWKRYGFVDAFNPLTGWVDDDVVGIDQGIGMLMAENARSEFVWRTFMRNPEVGIALQKCDFRSLGEPATLYSMRHAAGSPS